MSNSHLTCPNCKVGLRSGAKFCGSCGTAGVWSVNTEFAAEYMKSAWGNLLRGKRWIDKEARNRPAAAGVISIVSLLLVISLFGGQSTSSSTPDYRLGIKVEVGPQNYSQTVESDAQGEDELQALCEALADEYSERFPEVEWVYFAVETFDGELHDFIVYYQSEYVERDSPFTEYHSVSCYPE